MGWIILIIIVIFIIIGVNERKTEKKYKSGMMDEEEKKKYELKLERQKQLRKAKTIKSVIIVGNSSNSRKKAGSSIARGVVGGALLGPVGMVGGALSGKNKVSSKTTFVIEYYDGHRETKTVDNDSSEFKKLCNYLKMD